MRETNFFDGWKPTIDDLKRWEQIGPDALLRVFTSYWSLPGVLSGLAVIAGSTPNTVQVVSGLGFDRNGESILVTTTQVVEVPNTSGIVYYLSVKYKQDPTRGVYHPETGIGPVLTDPSIPYYVWLEDGYEFVVSTTIPSLTDSNILLSRLTGTGVDNLITNNVIDLTVVNKATIPQNSLDTLDHTLLENTGTLSHDVLENLINQLYSSVGATKGEVLVPSLLSRIDDVLNGNLDSLYVNKTSASYSGLVFRPDTLTNRVSYSAGKIVFRGVEYLVDTTSSPLPIVIPNTPKLIVGTLTTSPNIVTVTQQGVGDGVASNQIVFGLYNGSDDLFLRFGLSNTVIIPNVTTPIERLRMTDSSVNSLSSSNANKRLQLNNAITTAPVSVGNSTIGEINLGSASDTAGIRIESAGEKLIISPKTAGTTNKIILSKRDGVGQTDEVVLKARTIALEDNSTRVKSVYPHNTIDFSGTLGSLAEKPSTLREQLEQLNIYDNLMIYPTNGFTWNSGTEELSIPGGITIVCFFTGAILTANPSINPISLQSDYSIVYVNWNLRTTATKSLSVMAVNTPSFYISPSEGESGNRDEYRLVLAMRVPTARIVHRMQTLLT